MQLSLQRHRVLVLHLSFWCVYFSFFFYQISFSRGDTEVNLMDVFLNTLSHVGYVALAAYFNYYLCLPRFLKHKNLAKYLLEFSIPFAVATFFFVLLKRFQHIGEHYFYSEKFVVQVVVGTIFIVIFVGMLKFVEGWFELEAKKKALENEKLNAELRFLKAQINPHFLFNTLNNLYALAFSQSPKTTEVIAKLSEMMRYMIYDSNHPKVPLGKEIAYMENYIGLEKLRLNQPIPIEFSTDGDLESLQIVPLILIAFLENAFKHGVNSNTPNAWISINIAQHGSKIIYTIANSKNAKANHDHSGFGLQNVQRRLELSYPDKYKLEIQNDPLEYRVRLELNLAA